MRSQIRQTVTVHWTCDLPSHYNDVLFRALAALGFINLIVHYRYESLSSHPWKTPLRMGYASRIRTGIFGIDFRLIRSAFAERGSVFVLGGWGDRSSVLLLAILIVLRRNYILWTDTPNVSRRRRGPLAMFRGLLLRLGFRNALAILGTGKPAMDGLSVMGAPKDKIVNFPYWVEIGSEGPEALEPNSRGTLRFVSSGRVINSLKGHNLAVMSIASAFQGVRSVEFEYLIAGIGPDVQNINDLAGRLGIAERVRCLGWVEPSELATILSRSDILLHPSPVHEPYGVAVIEAMAAGMIVLASDATGAGLDRIEHGVNGFIHAAGNSNQLAEQIGWLVAHPEQIPIIKGNARRTALDWPVSRGVKTIERLLAKLV